MHLKLLSYFLVVKPYIYFINNRCGDNTPMSRFWFMFFIKGLFKSSNYFEGVTILSCPIVGMKLLGGPVSTDQKIFRDFSFERVSKTIVLMAVVGKLNDPQYELLLLCNFAGLGGYFMR